MTNTFDKDVTNLDYLLELSKGNTGFVQEMIETFLAENPKEIKYLEKGIQEKNFEVISQTAHLLQSTTPFVGLDKTIGSEIGEIQKIAANPLASNSDIEKITALFSKVKNVCEKSYSELKTTLEQRLH